MFNNQNIQRTCKGRIYPLIANSDTTYPYIVYKKTDIQSVISKDGLYQDNVSFTVTVVDQNYNTGCEIAQYVREALTVSRMNFMDGQKLEDCRMVSIDEQFSDNVYVQTLIFECRISL